MCDEIFYKTEGERCGIFRKTIGTIQTSAFEHHVCSNGLACFIVKDFQGNDIQQCITTKKEVGEQCIPDYEHCFSTYGCYRNAYELYTCDAKDLWKGNYGMDNSEIFRPIFQKDYATMIIGIIIIAVWIIGIIIFITNRYGREEYIDKKLLDARNEENNADVIFG